MDVFLLYVVISGLAWFFLNVQEPDFSMQHAASIEVTGYFIAYSAALLVSLLCGWFRLPVLLLTILTR